MDSWHNAAGGKMFRQHRQPCSQHGRLAGSSCLIGGHAMDAIVYLVGLVVIVMAILSFFGLR
jgi:amino acid permease